MLKELYELLVAAEENLIRYKEMGDENAILAGERMVTDLKNMIEENV